MIAKGSVLTGLVIESTNAQGKERASQLQLCFDQLRNKNLTMPLSATIEQITEVSVNSQNQIDDLGASLYIRFSILNPRSSILNLQPPAWFSTPAAAG